jgi:hypothetical protein
MVTGELGSGKSLALTYLAWSNYMKKRKNLFANYALFGMRYQEVKCIEQLNSMKEGFFAGDELWLWLDSRCSRSQKNKAVADILLKSRKRDLTIAYTSQNVHQMDRRIRDVTDFVAYPMMSPDNSFCRLEIFRGCRPSFSNRVKPPLYFLCERVYPLYSTYEEVQPIDAERIITELEKPKFKPVSMNPAWLRYLHDKGITDKDKIKKICEKIQNDLLRPEIPMSKIKI